MRKISLTLHLWLGLLAAVFLFVEGTTGGIMAWGPEILRMFNPPGSRTEARVYHLPPGPGPLSLTRLSAVLEEKYPGFRIRTMQFSPVPDLAWSAELQSPASAALTVWFNPRTGETLAEQPEPVIHLGWLQPLVQTASHFHGDAAAGIALFILACSGLVLWWPRRIFALRRPVSSSARTNFELHNAIGFYSSLFLLFFSSTAMVMSVFSRPTMAIISRLTHTPVRSVSAARRPTSFRSSRTPLPVRLDLDQALQVAARVYPGVTFTELRRLNDGNGALVFSYEERNSMPPRTSSILVDPVTGRVQEMQDTANFTPAEKFVRVTVRQVHSGEILGRPWRWIAGFFSFMLALLAVTGPAIWWLRRSAKRGPEQPA